MKEKDIKKAIENTHSDLNESALQEYKAFENVKLVGTKEEIDEFIFIIKSLFDTLDKYENNWTALKKEVKTLYNKAEEECKEDIQDLLLDILYIMKGLEEKER